VRPRARWRREDAPTKPTVEPGVPATLGEVKRAPHKSLGSPRRTRPPVTGSGSRAASPEKGSTRRTTPVRKGQQWQCLACLPTVEMPAWGVPAAGEEGRGTWERSSAAIWGVVQRGAARGIRHKPDRVAGVNTAPLDVGSVTRSVKYEEGVLAHHLVNNVDTRNFAHLPKEAQARSCAFRRK
jgi:hypothetical protein